MSAAVVTPAAKRTTVLHSVKPTPSTSDKALKPAKAAKKPKDMAAKQVKAKKQANGALSEAERRNHIEVAAYYIAQRRGFSGGSEHEDWIQAELEVDQLLK